MSKGSIYFVVAAGFALAALLNILDFGDSPRDKYYLGFEVAAALIFLVLGIRLRKPEAR